MRWKVGNRRHGDTGVYVGRPTALGNPFKVGEHGDIVTCLDGYRRWLRNQMRYPWTTKQRREIDRLSKMEPGTLVCWCSPGPCHAEIVADVIEEYKRGMYADRCHR